MHRSTKPRFHLLFLFVRLHPFQPRETAGRAAEIEFQVWSSYGEAKLNEETKLRVLVRSICRPTEIFLKSGFDQCKGARAAARATFSALCLWPSASCLRCELS